MGSKRLRWMRSRALLLGALVWLSVCGAGCASRRAVQIPPCPEPTEGLVAEILGGMVPPATERYLGRVELLCAALDVLRE
jgi:hypothetical protein